MSLKDEIMSAVDLPLEAVEVPEWKTTVYMRGLSAEERDLFESNIYEGKKINMTNLRARLVSLTVCDENGERIFKDEDIKLLGKKSGQIVGKLFDIAQRLSGMGAKDVEELTRNL